MEAKRPLGLLCALHVATLAAARPVLAEPAGQSARRAATANDTGHAPSEEHDVVVRGKRRPASAGPKDRAVAGSVVQRKRLSAAGSRAADALREVAGVQVTDTGGVAAPATASLRGATASETPVYLAGVRLNDDVAGTADLGTIPLFLVDRIEVYRGHAPIEADRLGLGGAIFFEPRRPETIGSGAALFGGSYGTRGGSVHVSAGGERHATVLGMRREVARNDYLFDNDSGTLLIDAPARTERRRNAEAALSDLWVLHRSRPGDARTDVLIHRVTREQGAPKLATVPAVGQCKCCHGTPFVVYRDIS